MIGTLRAIEMIMWSFDIKDFHISYGTPGEIIIETEKPLPREAIQWLEAQRPVGVIFNLKIKEGPNKPCICIGPPAKDCPVHEHL